MKWHSKVNIEDNSVAGDTPPHKFTLRQDKARRKAAKVARAMSKRAKWWWLSAVTAGSAKDSRASLEILAGGAYGDTGDCWNRSGKL